MSQLVRKQDLPPPGGYKPIPFERIAAKKYFSGYGMFAGYLAVTGVSLYLYNLNYKRIKREEVEMRSAKMAVYPAMVAERDREYLRQLRRNREAERELMKDVPGWVVGTYYGEKIYNDTPEDTLIEPNFYEYYAHADEKSFKKRAYIKLMS